MKPSDTPSVWGSMIYVGRASADDKPTISAKKKRFSPRRRKEKMEERVT
jgi:hypothetical protein